MILFCDTSALLKLYLHEDESDTVAVQASASSAVAVSRITWAEAMSGMARKAREQTQDASTISLARQAVAADWPRFVKLEVTQTLVELAGEYAEAFALRAYDSIQLASVRTLHLELPGEVSFACYDSRLVKAARVLGIEAG